MRAVTVALGLAWRWTALYAVLCFVTQVWAGSQYSPGQGGGLAELVKWAAIFGAIAVAVAVERVVNGRRLVEPMAAFFAAVVGQVVGTGLALAWFTYKGGPQAGDWWIGPAFAAAGVALWAHLLAPLEQDSVEDPASY